MPPRAAAALGAQKELPAALAATLLAPTRLPALLRCPRRLAAAAAGFAAGAAAGATFSGAGDERSLLRAALTVRAVRADAQMGTPGTPKGQLERLDGVRATPWRRCSSAARGEL